MKYFYHITTQKNAKKILQEGLKPMIGPRSQSVNETESAIFLCARKDVDYWRTILGLPTVLKIEADEIEIKKEDTYIYVDEYTEYVYYKPIEPCKIKKAKFAAVKPETIHDLSLSYMYDISSLCLAAARYYTYKDTEDCPEWLSHEYLQDTMSNLIKIIKNLDYSLCTNKEKRNRIREMGDGNYSFVDRYDYSFWNNDEKYSSKKHPRLYTMLVKYEKDDLYNLRQKLHALIVKNFKGCLTIDTGGWTG